MGNIIDSMCMTWRHDYGLYKADDDDSISSGMTTAERESLRRRMAQLHAHHIAPLEARIAELERASQLGRGEAEDAARWRHVYDGMYIICRWDAEAQAYVNIGGSYVARNTIDAHRASLDGRRES